MLVRPTAKEELRDRGMVLARVGRTDEALIDLRTYLDATPDAPDAQRVRLLIDELERG
jgi:regulator of sirC expression with transglutaminase-like and TPR domain